MESVKRCTKCQIEKPLNEFGKASGYKDGHKTWCKSCVNAHSNNYKSENRDQVRLKDNNRKLKENYGLSPDEYNRLLEQQNGVCAACGNPPNGTRLCVDHDHTTGAVRGLLCNGCNSALGHVNDDVSILQRLIGYVTR